MFLVIALIIIDFSFLFKKYNYFNGTRVSNFFFVIKEVNKKFQYFVIHVTVFRSFFSYVPKYIVT